MSHVVLLVNTSQMMKMKTYYADSLVDKLPPGSVFSARPTNCVITAYKSGKVLFQGGHADAEAAKWQAGAERAPAAPKTSSVKTHRYSPPATIGTMSVVGSDEV